MRIMVPVWRNLRNEEDAGKRTRPHIDSNLFPESKA
jgi:hypothetical protein